MKAFHDEILFHSNEFSIPGPPTLTDREPDEDSANPFVAAFIDLAGRFHYPDHKVNRDAVFP
jgi:hypothetical protein